MIQGNANELGNSTGSGASVPMHVVGRMR